MGKKNIGKSRYTFIDLFAGCGGLSLGFEQAGLFPLYVNEINNDALQTYLINRENDYPHLKNPKFHSKNIKDCINKNYFRNLKINLKKEFGSSQVDIVCGGPPCQGFSGIGIRRSYGVDKSKLPSNHLYEDMAIFIDKMQPKIFLFENVRGLLTARWKKNGKKGEIFKDVLRTFKLLKGYHVKYKLIQSKDYGVPQNRPRILIIGVKKNILNKEIIDDTNDAMAAGFLPKGSNDYPSLQDVLSDIIDIDFQYGGQTTQYPSKPKNLWQKNIRKMQNGKIAKKGDFLSEHEYSNHSIKVRNRFKAIIKNNGKIPKNYQTKKFAQRLLPKNWALKGPSITITSLPDDYVHFEQPRAPTLRECARMQTFPDWYNFAGKRTTGGLRRAGNPRKGIYDIELPKFTQIGNAVPVKLGYEIGKHFSEILKNQKNNQ